MGKVKDCLVIAKWGIKSRLVILLLQVLLHNVVPDHLGSMDDVFMKLYRSPEHPWLVERLLGGLDNWDAEYFIFNAHSGYTKHEQTMAFFPLLPLAMWLLSKTLLFPLTLLMPQRSVLLLSGALINFTVFPLTVVFLYLLTLELSHDRKLSLIAAGLFCFNPASVFMSSIYSETLFALFTFSGLLLHEKEQPWLTSILFAMATVTRSNGIVLCGFIAYRCLWKAISLLSQHGNVLFSLGRLFLVTALQCLVVIAPFCLFQYYGYVNYCMAGSFSSQPPWCDWPLPLPYSYIQEHYWDVGFLRYYQLKQVPNFMLASPIVLLVLFCVSKYFASGDKVTVTMVEPSRNLRLQAATTMNWMRNSRLRPYIFHLLFLFLFGIFTMHVQVLTRFICSSSPVIYWVSSLCVLGTLSQYGVINCVEPSYFSGSEIVWKIMHTLFFAKTRSSTISKAIVMYFLAYSFLGVLLHCNFYPWT